MFLRRANPRIAFVMVVAIVVLSGCPNPVGNGNDNGEPDGDSDSGDQTEGTSETIYEHAGQDPKLNLSFFGVDTASDENYIVEVTSVDTDASLLMAKAGDMGWWAMVSGGSEPDVMIQFTERAVLIRRISSSLSDTLVRAVPVNENVFTLETYAMVEMNFVLTGAITIQRVGEAWVALEDVVLGADVSPSGSNVTGAVLSLSSAKLAASTEHETPLDIMDAAAFERHVKGFVQESLSILSIHSWVFGFAAGVAGDPNVSDLYYNSSVESTIDGLRNGAVDLFESAGRSVTPILDGISGGVDRTVGAFERNVSDGLDAISATVETAYNSVDYRQFEDLYEAGVERTKTVAMGVIEEVDSFRAEAISSVSSLASEARLTLVREASRDMVLQSIESVHTGIDAAVTSAGLGALDLTLEQGWMISLDGETYVTASDVSIEEVAGAGLVFSIAYDEDGDGTITADEFESITHAQLGDGDEEVLVDFQSIPALNEVVSSFSTDPGISYGFDPVSFGIATVEVSGSEYPIINSIMSPTTNLHGFSMALETNPLPSYEVEIRLDPPLVDPIVVEAGFPLYDSFSGDPRTVYEISLIARDAEGRESEPAVYSVRSAETMEPEDFTFLDATAEYTATNQQFTLTWEPIQYIPSIHEFLLIELERTYRNSGPTGWTIANQTRQTHQIGIDATQFVFLAAEDTGYDYVDIEVTIYAWNGWHQAYEQLFDRGYGSSIN